MNIRLLKKLIQKLYMTLRAEKRSRYNRDLPLADYFVDRWERARSLNFGDGTSVYDSCLIMGKVRVGKNTWIGPFTILDGSGGELTIGDNCDISAGVHIYTHDTVGRVIDGSEVSHASVHIGNHTYIGPHSIVTKGVVLGDRVVIGANSLVNMDIPSNSKAFGTPVRIVGKV
jgi:acetyltransferase-like isoleucine patch superfamily enzyme